MECRGNDLNNCRPCRGSREPATGSRRAVPGWRSLAFCLLMVATWPSPATTPPVTAATPAPAPVLQLSGNDFPVLVVHQPARDENGVLQPVACAQIRGKRLDELDPLWKQAIERIHVDCDDLKEEIAGFDMVATVATGFLRPGLVEFAGIPVIEVRLMDSEMWGDHEYILERPYAEISEALERFVESHCRAAQDDRKALVRNTCELTRTAEGMYLAAGPLDGIWIHPLADDPRRTVYAEAWAD